MPGEARPKDKIQNGKDSPVGYTVQCQDEQTSPGVWSYTCNPPSDEKITLELEHVVQFQRSDLVSNTPKVLNIVLPNYKIKQIIQPEILPSNDDTPPLTVNIALEKPKLASERKESKDSSQLGRSDDDTASKPVVNVEYQPIDETDGKSILPSLENTDKDNRPVSAS